MSPLLIGPPMALGTQQAESAHSLMVRTATRYRVSMNSVLALLAAACSDRAVRGTSYRSILDLIGQGTLSRRLLGAMELLSGRQDVHCTTFGRLLPVIGHGMGLIAKSYRVCPECTRAGSGITYGMLAHQVLHIASCPLHGCALIDRCHHCGLKIGMLADPFADPACRVCRVPYHLSRRPADPLAPLEAWRQTQMLELVAYASDPTEDLPGSDWLARYGEALTGLVASPETYSVVERRDIRGLAKRIRQSPNSAPSMSSLLRVAAIQGVPVVDMIRRPIESCSARLLDAGDVRDNKPRRRALPAMRWSAAKGCVETLLRAGGTEPLSSKSSLLADLGVTPCGFWQRYPQLANAYDAERLGRRLSRREETKRVAQAAAQKAVADRLRSGMDVVVRTEAVTVRVVAGASKEISESAVRSALLNGASR